MKYTPQKAKEAEEWIAEHGLMEYGGARSMDFCRAMGIHDGTNRGWQRKYKEYSEAIERGKQRFKEAHTKKLFNTLMESAEGGIRESETENTEYRPNPEDPSKPMIVRMTKSKHKQWVKPDTGAAIFLLTNLDPEHYKNSMKNEVTIKKPETGEEMSLDEIKEEIKRLLE